MNNQTAIILGVVVLAAAGIGVIALTHKAAPPPPPKQTGLADVAGGLLTGILNGIGVH